MTIQITGTPEEIAELVCSMTACPCAEFDHCDELAIDEEDENYD